MSYTMNHPYRKFHLRLKHLQTGKMQPTYRLVTNLIGPVVMRLYNRVTTGPIK